MLKDKRVNRTEQKKQIRNLNKNINVFFFFFKELLEYNSFT